MKLMIFVAVMIMGILVVVLNPHLIADQIMDWAVQNPKDPQVVDILFKTARACEMLTDTDTATRFFLYIHDNYQSNAEFCAPAMYYCGQMKADSSYLKGIRAQAVPYLQVVLDEYPEQQEWVDKSKQLIAEVSK